MKLQDIQKSLDSVNDVKFSLPDGSPIPPHFHVTEVGSIEKNYIDCGGTIRKESYISFQLFTAEDYDHRLSVVKLSNIIKLSIDKLQLQNHEVEVEYQDDTIGKYGLEFDGSVFRLTSKQTDCLAKDKCGIPTEKPKIRLSALGVSNTSCSPESGCC